MMQCFFTPLRFIKTGEFIYQSYDFLYSKCGSIF